VLSELAGTMGYMAPEVFQRCYTEQADVWSTGVMLYEMVCGQLPFNLGNTCEEVSDGNSPHSPCQH
jgi:calcium-dependent protein kinase